MTKKRTRTPKKVTKVTKVDPDSGFFHPEFDEDFDLAWDRWNRLDFRSGPSRRYNSSGKLFLNPNETRDRSTHPYSYSEFFHFGDHESIAGCPANYSDRLSQWDYQKYDRLVKKYFVGKSIYPSPSECTKMLSDYFWRPLECTALVEGCNAGNGYPYLIYYHRYTCDANEADQFHGS